jgi:hypothetical protein
MKNSTKQDTKNPRTQIQFASGTPPGPLTNPAVVLAPSSAVTKTESEPLGQKSTRTTSASFELVLEAIRQRHETKTAILQEVLQRSQSAQQRFWGINE